MENESRSDEDEDQLRQSNRFGWQGMAAIPFGWLASYLIAIEAGQQAGLFPFAPVVFVIGAVLGLLLTALLLVVRRTRGLGVGFAVGGCSWFLIGGPILLLLSAIFHK